MLLVNLSASNITIGKAEYRRLLCASQSGKCISAYIYAAASFGESTTDLAWDGQGLIYEDGDLLAETERFSDRSQFITVDLDLERLRQDRVRMTSFNDCAVLHRDRITAMRRIPFKLRCPRGRFLSSGVSTGFPTSQPMPQDGTSGAARSTISKCMA